MIVRRSPRISAFLAVALAGCLVVPRPAAPQARITTPAEQFGFAIGDDYHLATYTQLAAYWEKLARESARMVLDTIGPTAEGRAQVMAVITSPANHARLADYRDVARRLARAEGLSDDEARRLAAEGRAVVWIDGGLHATEVLGAHQLMELVYQMVSRDDPETRRFLDDVILLAVHANPDGMELVSRWYMREPEPSRRSTRGIPRLYQKYIGHDNNRDFYMVTQPETENMARVMFREWFPQIVYNHHQTGPAGTVLFAPPFRDPFNYNYDPLIPVGIEMVGAAMHSRFIAEGKPGATMRSGASYSTWWNGGLRTTAYFHNMIGLLTETIGNPTPVEIPFIPDRQLPKNDLPFPIEPQTWHFRQSVDYSITANRAVLDYASRYRETLLYNIYRMGQNSIARGSTDHWTARPDRIEAVEAVARREAGAAGETRTRGVPAEYFVRLRAAENRDPRGYILPADQPDFPTAVKFVNTLIKNGVTVHQATAPFDVGGKRYPAGSFVVRTAQAFRPHVLDMFEPQDHPDDFAHPGGPPIPPYDNAGWTLAYQMGIVFDRVLDGFEGPFAAVEGPAKPPTGTVARAEGAAGFLLSHAPNDAAVVVNRVLARGGEVYWLGAPLSLNGTTHPAGTIYLPASGGTTQTVVRQAAGSLGVSVTAVRRAPGGDIVRIRPVRVGLWDRYGGSMPSGWTRWLLEQFEFPFEVVYPKRLDRGDLNRDFDVLVLPDGAIPERDRAGDDDRGRVGGEPDPETVPEEYRDRLGAVTVATTVPHIVEFLRRGGTVITIGSSTSLARHAGLPIADHVVDDRGQRLPREKFYVPGSVLQVEVDSTQPVAWGMRGRADVFFDNSPVFRLTASSPDVRPVARVASATPLRSGWAWGQEHLQGGIAAFEARVGSGRLFAFGPEILHRGQPHGTFKLFFNALYLAGSPRPGAAEDGARMR